MAKTRDQFKKAFRAIKKPARPKDVSGKDKSNLDSMIDKTTDFSDPAVVKAAADLYNAAPDYFVNLVAYKYAKHFDENSDKAPMWVQQVPKDAFERALKKVAPNDMSDPLSQAAVDIAVKGKGTQGRVPEIMYARDPDGMTQFNIAKWTEANKAGDKDLIEKWHKLSSFARPEVAIRAAVGSGDAATAMQFAEVLTSLKRTEQRELMTRDENNNLVKKTVPADVVDHASVLDIAKLNPANFINTLRGLKKMNQFFEVTSNPALQNYLVTNAKGEWDKLVAETPFLSLAKSVDTSIKAKKLGTDAEKVDELFDAIMNNRGMPLAYATNTLFNNRVILSGGTETDKAGQAIQAQAMGDAAPDLPATQCHQLLHLVEDMMNICPGLAKKPKVTQGTVDNILLTAPLGSIPGKGLLDKGFGGNVFKEDGSSCDQILFTGDSGMNSHTWLVIDGVEYDPVLGTKGAQVAASIGEKFDWLTLDRVAEGSSGNYIIKGARSDGQTTPSAKANKMGFGTGYLMTKTPEKFLTADELADAGISAAVGKAAAN